MSLKTVRFLHQISAGKLQLAVVWELHDTIRINNIPVGTLVSEHFRWSYYPKYYWYNFYDKEEKRFRKLIRHS